MLGKIVARNTVTFTITIYMGIDAIPYINYTYWKNRFNQVRLDHNNVRKVFPVYHPTHN